MVSLRLILFLLTSTIMCAQEVLEGKTINEATGEVVPFVNVIEKGTTNGTTSDFEEQGSCSQIS